MCPVLLQCSTWLGDSERGTTVDFPRRLHSWSLNRVIVVSRREDLKLILHHRMFKWKAASDSPHLLSFLQHSSQKLLGTCRGATCWRMASARGQSWLSTAASMRAPCCRRPARCRCLPAPGLLPIFRSACVPHTQRSTTSPQAAAGGLQLLGPNYEAFYKQPSNCCWSFAAPASHTHSALQTALRLLLEVCSSWLPTTRRSTNSPQTAAGLLQRLRPKHTGALQTALKLLLEVCSSWVPHTQRSTTSPQAAAGGLQLLAPNYEAFYKQPSNCCWSFAAPASQTHRRSTNKP